MKGILNAIPLWTILMVVISFLNLHFYYFIGFGIQIQHYLDVSEIIFSLTSFVSLTILFSIISLALLVVKRDKTATTNSPDSSNKNEQSKFVDFFRKNRFTIIRKAYSIVFPKYGLFIVASILFGTWLKIVIDESVFERVAVSSADFDYNFIILMLSGILFLVSLNRVINKDFVWRNLRWSNVYGFVAISILTYLITRNSISADLINKGYSKYSVQLELEGDSSLYTNDSLIFIGSTKNYYFFRNTNSEYNTIIPVNEIIEIKIKKLRGGL